MRCKTCGDFIEWDNGLSVFVHSRPTEDDHEAVLQRPHPGYLVALPLSSIYGREASPYESWGLIDPGEDDPAVIECVDSAIAQYLAWLWNMDHNEEDE